ncbi:hypothetical protein BKA62DRAFT_202077 [Auriculariales sp. MPI-PUGE-AT-0066]|nr:hypothetical protein BKA62DRAFT_202077 [Auriculariales sp. MPI-PUGE-AT-0066]
MMRQLSQPRDCPNTAEQPATAQNTQPYNIQRFKLPSVSAEGVGCLVDIDVCTTVLGDLDNRRLDKGWLAFLEFSRIAARLNGRKNPRHGALAHCVEALGESTGLGCVGWVRPVPQLTAHGRKPARRHRFGRDGPVPDLAALGVDPAFAGCIGRVGPVPQVVAALGRGVLAFDDDACNGCDLWSARHNDICRRDDGHGHDTQGKRGNCEEGATQHDCLGSMWQEGRS